MKFCFFLIRCNLNWMLATFEQFLQRNKVMGSQNIKSTFLLQNLKYLTFERFYRKVRDDFF